ncbi:MAG: hypothetical protein HY541_01225 [Deltaproteobacteria bacterium]|nr:hypothetical protein [Deltaproteobacteria bacterium]
MGKAFQSLLLFVTLVSIPFSSAFGEEPVTQVAVSDAQPAIRRAHGPWGGRAADPALREISKGAIGEVPSPEAKKVRIIEIVSHAIESSNKTARQENEVSVKSEETVSDSKEEVKAEEKVERKANDEIAEEVDDEAEEETFDDDDSIGGIKKKIAVANGDPEEEACDCGTIAEGECAPCSDEELTATEE